VRPKNNCFDHVLIPVYQGRKRRGAIAVGEEELGRCEAGQINYYRLYLYSGKLALAAMYLQRDNFAGRSFAAGAPPLTHVLTFVTGGARSKKDQRRGYQLWATISYNLESG
jgi:hypothetical protein